MAQDRIARSRGGRLAAALAVLAPLVFGVVLTAPVAANAATPNCNGGFFRAGGANMPGATFEDAYSAEVPIDGGTGPYHVTITSGKLPGGLTMDSAGLVSGRPTSIGTANFTIAVTDSSSPTCTATGGTAIKVGTQADPLVALVEGLVASVNTTTVSCLLAAVDTLLEGTPPACPGF